jgi:epoxide hydrolase-like predicted phosphatase
MAAARPTDATPGPVPAGVGLHGLVVDFGGVLTTSVRDAVVAFAEVQDVDPAQIMSVLASAYAGDAEAGDVGALETGTLPLEDFERSLSARLRTRNGDPLDAEGLVARMFSFLSIDDGMVAAVRRLHDRGVHTALLSNTWGVEHAMREEILELFDTIVLSGEVGLRKPNPEIYAVALARLGLRGAECAFVDDFEINVVAAKRAGLRAILHVRTQETIRQLEELFG